MPDIPGPISTGHRPPIGVTRPLAGVLMFALAMPAPAAEPTTVDDLACAFSASRAMDRGEPNANLYRAGRFDGYLVALSEALAARGEVCLPACSCEIRERVDVEVERLLADPALDRTQPAGPWLVSRLRGAFPCLAR